jgi:hypothetical protein
LKIAGLLIYYRGKEVKEVKEDKEIRRYGDLRDEEI